MIIQKATLRVSANVLCGLLISSVLSIVINQFKVALASSLWEKLQKIGSCGTNIFLELLKSCISISTNVNIGHVYKERGLPQQGVTLASGLPQQAGCPSKRVTLVSGLPQQAGYPSTHTFPLFFFRRVYKAARVTRVDGLLYLRARATLAGGLTLQVGLTRLPGLTSYFFPDPLSVPRIKLSRIVGLPYL